MSEFEDTLRYEIDDAQRLLTRAVPTDESGEFQRHRARLRDLLDVAARAGVDPSDWISPEVRPLLAGE